MYLICDIENKSFTFVVDFENNTVSGHPATITDLSINYKNGVDEILIDRVSGSVTVVSTGVCGGRDCYYYGRCNVKQGRQF